MLKYVCAHMHARARARARTHTHASFSVLPSTVRPQNCLIQSCAEGILCGHRTGVSARAVAGKPAQLGFVKKHTQGSHPWPPSQCRGWSPERATAAQQPSSRRDPSKAAAAGRTDTPPSASHPLVPRWCLPPTSPPLETREESGAGRQPVEVREQRLGAGGLP